MALKRELSFFDLMNIVIGAIVGSDIYIVSGLTASLIGPFAIVVWIFGGAIGMILVLVFAYCSFYVPNVGGSFAYVSAAFDEFWGFIAGWSMCIAEIVALPVFAIVFTNYLQFFIGLDGALVQVVRIVFVIVFTAINLQGVKAAGKVNDVLTIAKLTPLVMIIVLGLGSLVLTPSLLGRNYTPFAPFGVGIGNFSTALVLVFWAYAGFELGSLPASEVKDPQKTVPRALIAGMAIVIFFYVVTNFVVYGVVNWVDLANSRIPLVLVSTTLIMTVGGVITGLGALASVSGTDETEVLGTARLIYAMAIDGLLPKAFAKVHPRFKTPYVAIIAEGVIALTLSLYTGVTNLISFAVFNLGICYLLVCLALAVLKKSGERGMRGQSVLPWLGVAVSVYLLYSTTWVDKLVGLILVLAGLPVYFYFAPKTDIHDLKRTFTSEEEVLARNLERQNKFLANIARLVASAYRKASRKKNAKSQS